MATTAVSIEEYLSTAYEPDMDYVDGELEERNVGEYEHNVVQKRILFWFDRRAKEWRIRAVQEQRTRLSGSKVRISDVSVFSRDLPVEQVFTHPQMIAVEVLSPEDRHSRMDKKIRDYLDFGAAAYLGRQSRDADRLGLLRRQLGPPGTLRGRRQPNLPVATGVVRGIGRGGAGLMPHCDTKYAHLPPAQSEGDFADGRKSGLFC